MEMNSTYDIYKLENHRRISELTTQIDEYAKKCEILEENIKKSEIDLSEAREQIDSIKSEKSSLEREITALRENEAQLNSHITLAKQDAQNKAQLVEEANEKYQREVMAHSEALKIVNELKSAEKELKIKADSAEKKGFFILMYSDHRY